MAQEIPPCWTVVSVGVGSLVPEGAVEFGKKWFKVTEYIKRDTKPENRAKTIRYAPKL